MKTDEQVKRVWEALSAGKALAQSADKAGMDEKTARKYRGLCQEAWKRRPTHMK